MLTIEATKWDHHFTDAMQNHAITQLEDGEIIYFPELTFTILPDEEKFLSAEIADPKIKNINYHTATNRLWGTRNLTDNEHLRLKSMLQRYLCCAEQLIYAILPHYRNHLTPGRTSFRPIQITNRAISTRKNDQLLHVDAFPATPNQGKRLIRVFTNINPRGEDRIWRIGEKFEDAAKRFIPSIKKPLFGSALLLRLLKITKTTRTRYDHYMLKLHDAMKANAKYQASCSQYEIRFPPGSTWLVQTDQVSHAALQGQFALEQTFYLPVNAMLAEQKSPLRILEKILQQRLV